MNVKRVLPGVVKSMDLPPPPPAYSDRRVSLEFESGKKRGYDTF